MNLHEALTKSLEATPRRATPAEVRKHYRDLYCFCRITRDGHVTYRPEPAWHPGASPAWLEGRWVSEYRVTDDGVFLV